MEKDLKLRNDLAEALVDLLDVLDDIYKHFSDGKKIMTKAEFVFIYMKHRGDHIAKRL